MAYDASLLKRSTFGNQKVQFYSCTADAAAGTIVTGLKNVDMISMTPKSLSTGAIGVDIGVTAGTVNISAAVSGDEFYLMVYGH